MFKCSEMFLITCTHFMDAPLILLHVNCIDMQTILNGCICMTTVNLYTCAYIYRQEYINPKFLNLDMRWQTR